MKLANVKGAGTVVSVIAMVIAGFAGVLPIDILIPVLLFAGLVYGSVALIEKAIAGQTHAKELDRH